MKPILIEDIIRAVNGTINKNIDTKNIFVNNISIDTRTIKEGALFIPIIGKNFDGHNFIQDAFEKGAIACISEKDIETNKIIIKVLDTKKALKDLAKFYKSLFNIPTIAITGSTGKTTTKDIIANVLSKKYNVLKTEGNFNNEIGLPLTIFNIEDNTEIVVLEMGMNHFGEIHNLSEIAKPDIAIITNIGVSHIENLGSREGILRAKYEIFDYLKKDGLKILNADDDMLIELKNNEKYGKSFEEKFYSIEKEADIFATYILEKGLEGTYAKVLYSNKEFELNIKIAGKHILSNSLPAIIIGEKFQIDKTKIIDAIENFVPSKMRMDIIKTDKINIINDTYNANPNSMKASLDVLANIKGRKIAILGDMFELGEFSQKFHYEIGEYAVLKKIDELIFIGELSKYMKDGAINTLKKIDENININYFEKQEDFFENIKCLLKKGDNILIKASRGMKLEKTFDKIMRWKDEI